MYNQILAGNDVPAAAAMMGNRDCFTLLGDPTAKATGKHSTIDLLHAKTP